MCVLSIKTGQEYYGNRLHTADFFLIQPDGNASIKLTDHYTYVPHEEIICGPEGRFGRWEIGHVNLPNNKVVLGRFTKKIIYYSVRYKNPQLHELKEHTIIVSCQVKKSELKLRSWGYAGGGQANTFMTGNIKIDGIKKEAINAIDASLIDLPF